MSCPIFPLTPHDFFQVTSECESQMVGYHLTVLHAECKGMVEREDKLDLANMYRLLKPISGAQRGRHIFT